MKTFIFDLDGTMYRGSKAMLGGIALIQFLAKHHIPYYFLTNNSKRTRKQIVEHMEQMGYTDIHEKQFFNSAMGAAIYARKHSEKRKAWYIGEEGMKEALLQEGFLLVDENPDFVFVGLDMHATYHTYAKAVNFLKQGAVLIGTNKDRILAQENGFYAGNGAIVTMLEYASNQKSPDIGKPHYVMLEDMMDVYHIKKEDIILVGDNLETDIALGYYHDIETYFVLGGVHQKKDIDTYQIYPTKVFANLEEIQKDIEIDMKLR